MVIEIVDFPINSMVILHSYVNLPEGSIIYQNNGYVTMKFTNIIIMNQCESIQCHMQTVCEYN